MFVKPRILFMNKLSIQAIFVCLLIIPFFKARAEILDSSVAIVNEDVILTSEVEVAGAPIFRQIREEVPPEQIPKAMRQARERVIEQLIKKYLLLQQATLMHISVTEAEIDQAQERILQRGGADMNNFQDELRKIGITEQQYRENLKEQVLTSKLMNYAVRSKVAVPDEKIKEYYKK
ncbi:MAG: hypothetical protein D3923_14045, partial [Candidatus Electrothrix sp. AR3]|nr:hypothetical protein [Candidatus Electrothrix sp. AR3]